MAGIMRRSTSVIRWGVVALIVGALAWTGIRLGNEPAGPIPVIADYSPTVSDVGGLMYLLLNPEVEVIAVSLSSTGEAGCELGFEVTLGILALLDREHVPVACDPEVPVGARAWPTEFLSAHENLRFGLPDPTAAPSTLSAPDLIAQAAAASNRPVVIWAVGPLTNVARALQRHPDLADDIDRIVIMGGAVDVDGNVEGTKAEWNLWIDVAAAADVVDSGIPVVLVPLDATNDVPVPTWYRTILEGSEQSPAIIHLTRMVRIFPSVTSGFYHLWDELAAVVVVEPDLVVLEEMAIEVVEGGPDDGRTIRRTDGAAIHVATGVPEPNAFYSEFLGTLAGAPVPLRSATQEEAEYLESVKELFAAAAVEAEPVYETMFAGEEFDGPLVAEGLGIVFEIMGDARAEMMLFDPPESLREVADVYLEGLGSIVESRDAVLEAVAGSGSWDEAFAVFDGLALVGSCEALIEQAALLGTRLDDLPC